MMRSKAIHKLKTDYFVRNLVKKTNKKQLIVASIISALAAIALYFSFAPEQKQKVAVAPKKYVQQAKRHISKTLTYPETIQGKIITLKKLAQKFAFDYYNMFSSQVRKDFEYPEKMSYGEVDYHISYEIKEMKKNRKIPYTIWDNKDNRLVGAIQIREKDKRDPGQLSMWLNENYRGGGRIQEALFLISQAYFKARPATKSYNAFARTWNVASRKSMEKFGFVHIDTGTYKNKKDEAEEVQIYELTRQAIEKKAVLRK